MFKEELCTVCGECLSWCPYIEIESSQTKVEFEKLMDGRPSPVVSQCVSCMGCDEICPEKANPFSLVLKRQEEQNEIDRFPFGKSMFEHALALPSEVVVSKKGGPLINLCRFGEFKPEVYSSILFDDATFIKGGEYYCRFGYYHIGSASMVEDHMSALVDKLAAFEADEIVCLHDDCYSLFTVKAPELGVHAPFRAVSWPEFLYTQMNKFKSLIKPLNLKAAYQRPCASHYTPEKDRYIDDLLDLIGIDKPAREYEKEKSLCCGLPVMARDQALSERFLRLNLEDAKTAGADMVVALCPVCFDFLNQRAPEFGLKAIHITELCRLALGEVDAGSY